MNSAIVDPVLTIKLHLQIHTNWLTDEHVIDVRIRVPDDVTSALIVVTHIHESSASGPVDGAPALAVVQPADEVIGRARGGEVDRGAAQLGGGRAGKRTQKYDNMR